MKTIYSKIMISAALMTGVLGFASCTDYLDKAPLSDIGSEEAYQNYRSFQGFCEEFYTGIPLTSGFSSHCCFNLGEDEIWETVQNYTAVGFDQGDFWRWENDWTSWFKQGGNTQNKGRGDKANLWGLSWACIRKTNVGIAHLDLLTDATTEEKQLIEGQLYFFRAWYHFMLIQYWGGLPYIDTELPLNEPLRQPRLTYQECADKAAADFQHAADLLPVDWDQTTIGKQTLGNNNLRANKIMALAYMGKNLLWAGSPLMNRDSGGKAEYNADYCKRAADALGQALKLTEETKRYELASFDQWTDLFYTHNQNGRINGLKEAIFMESLAETSSRWRWNMVNDFRPKMLMGSGVRVYPTANYVNYAYGMKNGMPITDITKADAESGYDPQYPWKNRDPRFYKDIIYDGVQCTLNSKGDQSEFVQYASLYTGGLYKTDNNTGAGPTTGFLNSKLVPQLDNQWDGYRENNTLVLSFMRLADVYLMYAEAVAKGYGSPTSTAGGYSGTALDAVNKIRQRAGVDAVNTKFTSNVDAFINEVRRERAVELAFEGHRFVDIRRWLLLTVDPYNKKTQIEFDRDSGKFDYKNPQNAKVLNLREVTILVRNLSQKHYWFPLPKKDVNLYPELYQNPGW